MKGIKHTHTPGAELHRAVKAGFMFRGTTLASWCRTNKVFASNARQALLGSWAGPKARKLVNKLIADSQAEKLLNTKKDAASV
ncbi:MAG: hypothetical protein COA54_02380 [Thiotrichaceae bacterium]|nr:MAG: hypothetical protein COA54_02380 [Thiotrichaceae bacterium]